MGVIFTLLMKFIVSITNLFLLPINTIVVNLFPDFTDKINYFESLVGRYVVPLLSWFFQILPPNTRSLILFYLGTLILLYTATLAVHGIIKVIELIKNIKVW